MPKTALHHLSRKRFGQNLLILTVGEILTRMLTFVAFAHLARVLKPEVFGVVEIALAVIMIATLMTDMGFPVFGAREVARGASTVSSLAGRIVSAEFFLAIVTYAVLALFVLVLPLSSQLRALLLGLGVSLLGTPFLLIWAFQGRNRMTWVAVPQVIRRLVFAVLVISFIRHPGQVMVLPLAEIAAVGLSAGLLIVVFFIDGNTFKFNPRAGLDRALLVQVLPVGGSQLIWAVRMFLPIILLGAIIGQANAGYFGAAHRIMMVLQVTMGVYFINLFPTLSQAAETSSKRLANILHHSLTIIIWPAIALALAVTLAAPFMIRLVFGQDYMRPESISVLRILIWVIPLLAWRRHGYSALVALHRQREEFGWSFMGMLALLVLLPILTLTYGGIGTAWAMLISELLAVILIFACLKRHAPELHIRRCLASFLMPPTRSKEAVAAKAAPTIPGDHTHSTEQTGPIFIVGAPRSGTTLLREMLNRHPAIAICHETHYYYYVYLRRRAFGDLNDPARRQLLVERYLATRRIRGLGLDNKILTETLMQNGTSYNAFFDALLHCYAAEHGKRRYGDKTPIHSLFADTLCTLYPDCKIIHLVRDPRDVVASLHRMPWGHSSLLGDARLWKQYVLAADRCSSRKNYLLVCYSDLVTQPVQELQRICRFVGEQYSEDMLEPDDAVRTDEWWFQRAHKPLSTNRIGVWRSELSPRQVALVEWVTSSTMSRFGYQPDGLAASPASIVFALLKDLVARTRRKLFRLPRTWYFWMQPTRLAEEEAWIDRYH